MLVRFWISNDAAWEVSKWVFDAWWREGIEGRRVRVMWS